MHFHEDLLLNLEPGQYFLRVKIYWNSIKYNTARLISDSEVDLSIVERMEEDMQPVWRQIILGTLKTCEQQPLLGGKISMAQKWMKGEYFAGLTHIANSSVL